MILTIGATKGGVGKSTIALNIAVARALAGRHVLAVDSDADQGSLSDSFAQREAVPIIACDVYREGKLLRQQVKLKRESYDDIIIDTGGHDSNTLRAALTFTDVLVVPFMPRSYDIWALKNVVKLVEEANDTRDGLRVILLLNKADAQGGDNAAALELAADLNFEVLSAKLGDRKAFSDAVGRGLSVLEIGRDTKAKAELNAVVDALFTPEKHQRNTKRTPSTHATTGA